MRTDRRIAATAAAALLAIFGGAISAAIAQQQPEMPLEALEHGQLTVWVLEPAPPNPLSKALQIAALHNTMPLTYTERDTGNFGHDASKYGVDSNKYGVASTSSTISAPPAGTGYHEQTSGSFGQNANTYGTDAGKYGENVSSLGEDASKEGVNAGDYGRNVGSFGHSLATIAQAGNPPAPPAPGRSPQETAQLRSFEQRVRSAFPELRVRYRSVDPADLRAQLAAAHGSDRYPDLLIAPDLSAPDLSAEALTAEWWPRVQREFGLATLQPAPQVADGVTSSSPAAPQIVLLARAPHRSAERAFALWLSEAGSGCDGCVHDLSPNARAAAAVAASAVTRLLHGEPVGDEADPHMAALPPSTVRLQLADSSSPLPETAPLRIEVETAAADSRLAAVALRAVASSSSVFAVVHSLVVLRKDAAGRWRVLHVSLDLPPAAQQRELRALSDSFAVAREQGPPRGISQASPPDGDTRPPEPTLWWDNRGGATLQVIEWQSSRGGAWSGPLLYLAPDAGPRLRTEVAARFANAAATYRWRVWSVGDHGRIRISPWSMFHVVRQ